MLAAAIAAAARSVERTPSLLPVLADAGVVDSGGQGLLRILEGTIQLDGSTGSVGWSAVPDTADPAVAAVGGAVAADGRVDSVAAAAGYGYETVYLVESTEADLDLDALRRELEAVGESIVVAGDARMARVHIHGPRPDQALAIGLRLGRVSEVGVTDLDAGAADVAASPSDVVGPALAGPSRRPRARRDRRCGRRRRRPRERRRRSGRGSSARRSRRGARGRRGRDRGRRARRHPARRRWRG